MSVKSLTLSIASTALIATLANATPGIDDMQSLPAVQRAAETALRRELDPHHTGVKLTAAALDARLRLPACPAALETQMNPPRGAQTRVLVRVSCKAPANWNINVPVDIRRDATVLILRRAVARGESIGAGDVSAQRRTLAGMASPYIASVTELSGRRTRRALPEGTAVTAEAMDVALLIHRGQSVTLTARSAGIEVRAPGLAMAGASVNQRVRVQNLRSLKIVEGVADSDGVVKVNP